MSPIAAGEYDEEAIKIRLRTVAPEALVAFAASCAERLFLLYREVAKQTGSGDEPALRAALDVAWSGGRPGERASAVVDAEREIAESLVPDEDGEDWTELSPLAQNAAAAVAYALRAWRSADAQDGVWAARQVYEAGDFLDQVGSPPHQYADSDRVDSVAALLAGGIAAALADCDSGDLDRLRADAVADGERLLAFIENGGP